MVTWADAVMAVGAAATPLLVAYLVFALTRRQSRSSELVAARLDYYRALVPDLNALMCYFTFIGTWSAQSPPEIIALKRRLDATFYCALPLFSAGPGAAYQAFLEVCFSVFNEWGSEPRLRTSAYHRRDQAPRWEPAWDGLFVYPDDRAIGAAELLRIRGLYDAVLVAMVRDLDITRARPSYTTDLVARNAVEVLPVSGSRGGP